MVLLVLSLALAQECPVIDVLDCDTRRIFESDAPAADVFSSLTCASGSESAGGPERIWELDLSGAPGAVTIDYFRQDGFDMGSVAVLEGSCEADACLTTSGLERDVVTFQPDPTLRYWLVVSSNGSPTVDISCLPAPGSTDADEPETRAETCGASGGASAWLLPVPLLALLRRRVRASRA